MKIVHVETGMHLYGGAQQVAYLLAGLAGQGIDNVLVCPPGAAIGQHFAGSRVKVIETPCAGDLDLGFLLRLRRVLREERPDLVHLHSRRGADVLGGIAARLAGVPAILSRRVDNPESRLVAALKYRLYARVVCISQGIADVLLSEGVPADKVVVVRSAVDAAPWTKPEPREAFCREFGVRPDAPILGVVAQLIERKGHHFLFEALAGLKDQQDFSLVVFGQGPRREALEQQAHDLGLADRIRFAGFRKDLPRWLGGLDLLVHPALMEGLGVSLLQASAAGVPIIASRAGGMPEAVRDGVNGALVPPGNVAALVVTLERLLSNASLRKEMGLRGSRLVASEFSVRTMALGNLRIYLGLASRSPR
jgi:glycosyltransferase involved in cell wall biosynthesis